MTSVLFVDCPDGYAGALPDAVLALATDGAGLRDVADAPDLVVIGPATAQPSALAQRAAKAYPGVDVLITAPDADVSRLRDILTITPYIPLRTEVVADEPREALERSIREAVERCSLRKGHQRVLESVQQMLSNSHDEFNGQARGSERPAQKGVDQSGVDQSDRAVVERRALQRFFAFYQRVRRDLTADVNEATREVVAPAWPLRWSVETSTAGLANAHLAIERDLVDGRWKPYVDALAQIGKAHAQAGRGFGEWLNITHQFRRGLTGRLFDDEASAEAVKEVVYGMETFLNVTLIELQRAYSQAQIALLQKHETNAQLFAVAVESSDDAIITTSVDGEVTAQNPAAERMFGYSDDEVLGRNIVEWVGAEQRDTVLGAIRRAAGGDAQRGLELDVHDRQGRRILVGLTISPVRDATCEVVGLSVIARDLTEQRGAEAALRQSQKMEAVGRLAGGIAHDFNNLLTVILANSSFMKDLGQDKGLHGEGVDEIIRAAERAQALTRQLLTFSRSRPLRLRTIDPATAVVSTNQMLRRTFPSNIEVAVLIDEGIFPIRIDPGQFDQVLMNLALNARDAMPDGGRLTLQLTNQTFGQSNGPLPAGDYVELRVSDTGTGIEPSEVAHVFEPFFTTKDVGQGTGLGLATCYSIARKAGGDIRVTSDLDRGTTFTVWLPRALDKTSEPSATASHSTTSRGSETILVVEDDPAVRSTVTRALEHYGYSALAASNGEMALRLLDRHSVALVLTDAVMPQMSGPELAEHLAARYPGLPVLFMTGYVDADAMHHHVLGPDAPILPKPFQPLDLARAVRQLLDARAAGASSAVGGATKPKIE